MVLMYILGFGPYVSRLVLGPLPGLLCKLGTLGQQFFGMNICFLAVSIGWIKVAFAYIYKSIPIMEDKFFATFIMLIVNLLSLLSIGAKTLVEEKEMLITDVRICTLLWTWVIQFVFQRICSSTWSEKELGLKNFPVAALTAVGSWIAYSVASAALKFKKAKPVTPLQGLEHKKSQSETKLETAIMTYLAAASIAIIGGLFLSIQK